MIWIGILIGAVVVGAIGLGLAIYFGSEFVRSFWK
jgi:hypothetical protein